MRWRLFNENSNKIKDTAVMSPREVRLTATFSSKIASFVDGTVIAQGLP